MSNSWSRYLSLILSGSLALFAFGCGDDDGGGDRPDARPTADSAPEDDADVGPTQLRSGTIAVTEATITNDLGVLFSGGLVRVGFSDSTTGNPPAPVAGFTSPVGGCLVQVWDVGTHEPSTAVDEGAVQVTGGTTNGDFACGFASAAVGYVCQSTTPAIAGGAAVDFTLAGDGEGGGILTFVGGQAAEEMVGTYAILTGFGAADGQKLAVLDFTDGGGEADTLTLAGNIPAGLTTGAAGATYSTYVGANPLPTGTPFLGGAADTFTVQKAAGGVVGAIDEDFGAHGQNFALTPTDATMDIYEPHTVPFEGVDVTFACTDECGVAGTGGLLGPAMVINGETTDAPVDPLTPATLADAMPDPETQYATFQCSFFGEDEATLPAAAMEAIIGTNPTRIQVSVGRYRGSAVTDEAGEEYQIFLLQGHAALGWSDAV